MNKETNTEDNKIEEIKEVHDVLPLIDDTEDNVEDIEQVSMLEEKDSILMKIAHGIGSLFIGLIIGLIILLGVRMMGFTTVRVDGTSMYPTYKNGEFLVFHKTQPKDKEIIVFHPSKYWDKNTNKLYIKRVVAKPGDTLHVHDGKITVNGKLFRKINKAYADSTPELWMTIPKNKYFVMGDNYKISNDSLYNYKTQMKHFLVDKSQIKFTAPGRNLKS